MSDDKLTRATCSAVAAKLLPKFIGHRERDVDAIRLALERDDFETIARLGHNMRGNGLGACRPKKTVGRCALHEADGGAVVRC